MRVHVTSVCRNKKYKTNSSKLFMAHFMVLCYFNLKENLAFKCMFWVLKYPKIGKYKQEVLYNQENNTLSCVEDVEVTFWQDLGFTCPIDFDLWVQISVFLLSRNIMLSKSLNLSMPQIPFLENEGIIIQSYIVGLINISICSGVLRVVSDK